MATETKTVSPAVVVIMLAIVLALPLLPLLISQRWGWWEAWVYAGLWIIGFFASRVLAVRRHPDLLAERARSMQHTDTKAWDRWLAPAVVVGTSLMPLAAGLEARWGVPPVFALAPKALALAAILAGYAISTYALVENRYFSGTVRIQHERGHTVVSSGPYRWVRHPGYVGALLLLLATPIWLNSLWAMVPGVFGVLVLVVRTALEDRTLQAELAGYRAYAAQVRWRLIPWVW